MLRMLRKSIVLSGLFLLMAALALAQVDYPKVEAAGEFLYIRTPVAGQYLNCAGGAGTVTYNFSRYLGGDFTGGGCKFFGQPFAFGNQITGAQYNFLAGPRLTFRNNSPVAPFADVAFGFDRVSFSCHSGAFTCINLTGNSTVSKNAFALTAGGGVDIKMNKKVAIRAIQADYFYSRFGNDCPFAVCATSNSQNGLRLQSGIVIGWGGSASH